MSYLSGKAANMVKFKTDEEVVALALDSLKNLFPDEVRRKILTLLTIPQFLFHRDAFLVRFKDIPEPDNYLVTHWSEDPYAGMSYSYVKVGSSGNDYDSLAEELDGKLFFAGEVTVIFNIYNDFDDRVLNLVF